MRAAVMKDTLLAYSQTSITRPLPLPLRRTIPLAANRLLSSSTGASTSTVKAEPNQGSSTTGSTSSAGCGSGVGSEEKTHFGFEEIPKAEKEERVGGVFASVAQRYDLMNDFMSGSLHRLWKERLVNILCPLASDADDVQAKHIDVAGGTGDIAFRILEKSNAGFAKEKLAITVYDINEKMLEVGKQRAVERNLWREGQGEGGRDDGQLRWVQGNAETLPFADASFDSYTIAFGIRNCTNIPLVLAEAYRVLKPGGRFLCLEFSHVANPLIRAAYDQYSFKVIPVLGQIIADDKDSYKYLVESIRQFPQQREFERMIREAGFDLVRHENLTHGVVAIHSGFKLPREEP